MVLEGITKDPPVLTDVPHSSEDGQISEGALGKASFNQAQSCQHFDKGRTR